jgi:hypothetical protein
MIMKTENEKEWFSLYVLCFYVFVFVCSGGMSRSGFFVDVFCRQSAVDK